MHGLVVHDRDDVPLRSAITWEDRRSAETLAALLAKLPTSHPEISTGYQAASWRWLTANEPEVTARATRLLLPKDELIYRLTGEHVTDPSDAIGTGWYDPASEGWDAGTVDAAGATPCLLPRIVPAGSVAGPLTREAGAALGLPPGIPVVIAGGDAAVAAFGAGATDPNTPLVMLSTGCQVLQLARERPGSGAWPSANPSGLPAWLRVATTLTGGNVVRWARETLGDPATASDPDLVFLPWLAAARSTDLAVDAGGAFVGLREHHTRAALARAAVDGVSLALADAFGRGGGEIGVDAPVLAGGGGTRDDIWLAGLADALGRTVLAISEPDLSAWGAARAAATTLGWIDPVSSPSDWRPDTRPVAPTLAPKTARARLDRYREIAQRLHGPGT
jgi:xylulokinase